MKRFAPPLLAAALLASVQARAAPPGAACLDQPGTLLVFAGQSNMVGWGMSPMTLPKGYMTSDPLTCIWSNGRWEPMRPGFNTGGPQATRTWGPEASFAKAFRRAYPDRPLLVVKTVKGGSGIAADPEEDDWSPSTRGELMDSATETIAAARKALPMPTPVSAVFWMQGEQDAFKAAKAQDYRTNFPVWLATIRSQWMQDANGYVIWGRISTRLPFSTTVRDAQLAVSRATPNTAIVEVADLAVQNDQLHLASRGHVELGERFFRAFVSRR